MPIHPHLNLPTSTICTPKAPSQTRAPHTLYHYKHLKTPVTKEAFTKTLAKKVSRTTPIIQSSTPSSKVTRFLHNPLLTPQTLKSLQSYKNQSSKF
jgi:hypothetical protein